MQHFQVLSIIFSPSLFIQHYSVDRIFEPSLWTIERWEVIDDNLLRLHLIGNRVQDIEFGDIHDSDDEYDDCKCDLDWESVWLSDNVKDVRHSWTTT